MRVLLAVLALAVAGCSNDAQVPLVAVGVEITAPMPGRGMSAGFMTLENNTDKDLKISRIVSSDYERVEMHESRIEDGVAKMRRIPELIVPADSSLSLERGGLHLMLIGAVGTPDKVSLSFFAGETLLLNVSAGVGSGKE